MPIFKPKSGPLFRWSRGLHVLWGLAASGGSGFTAYLDGSNVRMWAFLGWMVVTVLGFMWEVSNRYTGGWHPYGDIADWWAFVVGGGLGFTTVLVIT